MAGTVNAADGGTPRTTDSGSRRQRYCEMCDRWWPAGSPADCRACGAATRLVVVRADRTEIVDPRDCGHLRVTCGDCGQVIVKTPEQVR